MDKIREQIDAYVRTLLAEHGHAEQVRDDDALVSSGLLDSFAVLRLVVFLERTFAINFADEHFDQNIFDTIAGMTSFVSERRLG